jgi:hypothetical protein
MEERIFGHKNDENEFIVFDDNREKIKDINQHIPFYIFIRLVKLSHITNSNHDLHQHIKQVNFFLVLSNETYNFTNLMISFFYVL